MTKNRPLIAGKPLARAILTECACDRPAETVGTLAIELYTFFMNGSGQ
jgi:hypothetical protein